MYLIDGEALSNAFDEAGADICTEYGNWDLVINWFTTCSLGRQK